MEVTAPLTGTILRILVQEGDEVADGDELIVMESMKMEIYVNAMMDGTVKELRCTEGDVVQADDVLLVLD
jgi:acetyl-CoA carboxylase biotin carboxyl carrier protein